MIVTSEKNTNIARLNIVLFPLIGCIIPQYCIVDNITDDTKSSTAEMSM